MIYFYTFTKRTAVFAEVLGRLVDMPLYKLESELDGKSAFGFIFAALVLTFRRKTSPILNMPTDPISKDIYVCSPIWGGRVSAPARYFLENANLTNTRVHLLLTASIPHVKYRDRAEEYLRTLSCQVGKVMIFATSDKTMPEEDVLLEHIREALEDE